MERLWSGRLHSWGDFGPIARGKFVEYFRRIHRVFSCESGAVWIKNRTRPHPVSKPHSLFFTFTPFKLWGTRWRSWLRHGATSRKVAGSIPDGVIGIFHWHIPSGRTTTTITTTTSTTNTTTTTITTTTSTTTTTTTTITTTSTTIITTFVRDIYFHTLSLFYALVVFVKM
jgi:hypothetical protein